MRRCECGCGRVVRGAVGGREAIYASEACRIRAHRDREHRRLAIDTADLVVESPDSALRRALAALPPAALRSLAENLAQALYGPHKLDRYTNALTIGHTAADNGDEPIEAQPVATSPPRR